MALFFTADTHFGDHRTINIHRRPFTDVASMDETIVTGWNEVVGPQDEVWHLGDVARRSGDVASLLARLNGVKHLVRGNNDGPGLAMPPVGRACRTMPSSPRMVSCWCCATILSGAGTGSIAAQSTCTAIVTAS